MKVCGNQKLSRAGSKTKQNAQLTKVLQNITGIDEKKIIDEVDCNKENKYKRSSFTRGCAIGMFVHLWNI